MPLPGPYVRLCRRSRRRDEAAGKKLLRPPLRVLPDRPRITQLAASRVSALSHPPIDWENLVDLAKRALVRRGMKRLGRAEANEPKPRKALQKEVVDAVLQRFAELRQHAAGNDAVEFIQGRIRRKAVRRENDLAVADCLNRTLPSVSCKSPSAPRPSAQAVIVCELFQRGQSRYTPARACVKREIAQDPSHRSCSAQAGLLHGGSPRRV